jgi:hypothetical protein
MHAENARASPRREVFEDLELFALLVVLSCATFEPAEAPQAEAISDSPTTTPIASATLGRFALDSLPANVAISSPSQLTDLCA